jgi:hypothetical protein
VGESTESFRSGRSKSVCTKLATYKELLTRVPTRRPAKRRMKEASGLGIKSQGTLRLIPHLASISSYSLYDAPRLLVEKARWDRRAVKRRQSLLLRDQIVTKSKVKHRSLLILETTLRGLRRPAPSKIPHTSPACMKTSSEKNLRNW